jgi:hypothetical protein
MYLPTCVHKYKHVSEDLILFYHSTAPPCDDGSWGKRLQLAQQLLIFAQDLFLKDDFKIEYNRACIYCTYLNLQYQNTVCHILGNFSQTHLVTLSELSIGYFSV